jgi:hypothetical protein
LSPIARPSLSTSLLRRLPATTHLWSFSNAPRSAQLRISVQVRGKPTSPRRIVNNGPHSPSHKRSRVQSPVFEPQGHQRLARCAHEETTYGTDCRVEFPAQPIHSVGLFRTIPDSAGLCKRFSSICSALYNEVASSPCRRRSSRARPVAHLPSDARPDCARRSPARLSSSKSQSTPARFTASRQRPTKDSIACVLVINAESSFLSACVSQPGLQYQRREISAFECAQCAPAFTYNIR